jgi:hypothetical protein
MHGDNMKGLRSLLDSIDAQRTALHAMFGELQKKSKGRAAFALFDALTAGVDDLLTEIEAGGAALTSVRTEPEVTVDEDKLNLLFGKSFVDEVQGIENLASSLVEHLCSLADEVTNEARAELGLRKLKPGGQQGDEKRIARKENKSQVAAHGREYLGVSLRDYACALEQMLQTLTNMLYGAALLALAQRMPEKATTVTTVPGSATDAAAGAK